jgi:hypothetical protein
MTRREVIIKAIPKAAGWAQTADSRHNAAPHAAIRWVAAPHGLEAVINQTRQAAAGAS